MTDIHQLVAELPPRALTKEDIDAFWRDGVICIRGLYSPKWIQLITEALEEICAKPSPYVPPEASKATQKFRSDIFSYLTFDKVRDFILTGPSAHIAQQAFGSKTVNFFYDQIFVKEKLTPDPTPWHQDFTFWPLAGNQIASIWTSVDAVNAESSALEFVAGSHLGKQRYKAVGVGGVLMSSGDLENVPNIDADRSKFNVLSWELEPGDALLFHALILHGALGNSSPNTKRRAITTRWCGDDVTYAPKARQLPIPWSSGLTSGDPLSGFLYPQILPNLKDEEVGARLRGPIPPEPAKIVEILAQLATAERVPVQAS